jgi:Ca2+-binding RTX toxin-like protein
MSLVYRSISGTNGNDTAVLTHGTVANWEHSEWDVLWGETVHTLWDGGYHAGAGNDLIIRDRPGAYRLRYDGTGDGFIFGDSGTDTISYHYYTGPIDIDLADTQGHGTARTMGLSGQTIYGIDRLLGIENATGTVWGDLIRGSNSANTLTGGNGADEMHGEGGNDTLLGGSHADELHGGSGNDTIKGNSGDDWLYGNGGKDFLYGGTGSNRLRGGDGDDTLLLEGGGRAYGDAGDDILVGGATADKLYGGDGNDTLTGLAGNDDLIGNDGHDKMLGGDGNDRLYGGTGRDVIHGGNGNDLIEGGANSDELRGGYGIDTAVWDSAARVSITIGRGTVGTAIQLGYTDSLSGIENFKTGSGNDYIKTGSSNNVIDAGAGVDYVLAGSGNDAVLAGNGHDIVYGEAGRDSLLGGAGDDWLRGDRGNDTLSGGIGRDELRGGTGTDTLFGGNDADEFVFAAGDNGIDAIRDFALGEDTIRFDDFLADEPEIGESYLGRIYAVAADAGYSTVLVALTDDGWQAFAKIAGNGNVAAFTNAIADGSLF